MFEKIKEHFSNGVTITGKNTEDLVDVKFELISESKLAAGLSEYKMNILKRFEDKIKEIYLRSENGTKEETTITPMKIEDGKVVVDKGTILHRCTPNLETLKNISVGGVLATEWFGSLESESEGRLCAFVVEYKEFDSPTMQKITKREWTADKYKCFLYFDQTNPIMQELLSIDFFEYFHIKQTNPEKLPELYSPSIIELFDTIIVPLSPAGKYMHEKDTDIYSSWRAIPGGIPPALVNGLSISTESPELMENIAQLRQMYPNAVIFDQDKNVICLPLTSDPEYEIK